MEKPKKIADYLINQHKDKKRFENLSGELLPVSPDEAYLAQFQFQTRALRGPLGGFKIALSSITQQELCGINTPIAGGVFLKEIFHNKHRISLNEYHGLGLEFELAFRISKQIFPNDFKKRDLNLLSSIDNIYPAFELIIDRNADYKNLDALTLIADNAWSAGVVLGSPILNWENLNLEKLNSTLHWNAESIVTAHINSANPLNSLEWIINHLGKQGKTIPKGSIIITGSVIQTRKPSQGDKIIYKIEDLSEVEVLIV